jgi:hypothetical protein
MTFVQFPTFGDGNPHAIGFFQDMPQCTNGTSQQRRMRDIGFEAFGLEQLTRLNDFFMTLGAQRTIVPSGKLVFQVPSGFSVSDQDQGMLFGSLNGSETKINNCATKQTQTISRISHPIVSIAREVEQHA